jgi:hypothetical protein
MERIDTCPFHVTRRFSYQCPSLQQNFENGPSGDTCVCGLPSQKNGVRELPLHGASSFGSGLLATPFKAFVTFPIKLETSDRDRDREVPRSLVTFPNRTHRVGQTLESNASILQDGRELFQPAAWDEINAITLLLTSRLHSTSHTFLVFGYLCVLCVLCAVDLFSAIRDPHQRYTYVLLAYSGLCLDVSTEDVLWRRHACPFAECMKDNFNAGRCRFHVRLHMYMSLRLYCRIKCCESLRVAIVCLTDFICSHLFQRVIFFFNFDESQTLVIGKIQNCPVL